MWFVWTWGTPQNLLLNHHLHNLHNLHTTTNSILGGDLYIYIYIYVQMHLSIHIYICKCMWIDTHTHIYTYLSIYCFKVHIYIYRSIYLSIYLCVYVCRLSDKPDQGSPIAPLLLQASGLCPSRRAAVPAPASPRERGQSHGAGTQLQEPGPETGHTRTIHWFKL